MTIYIKDLDISNRIKTVLHCEGYETLEGLYNSVLLSHDSLKWFIAKMPNIGDKSTKILVDIMHKYGFYKNEKRPYEGDICTNCNGKGYVDYST